MIQKKTIESIIESRKRDLGTFLIYWYVTRIQHISDYKKDGKFDVKKLFNEIRLLKQWDEMDEFERFTFKRTHTVASMHFNYAFGIPKELLQKVLGSITDEDGKERRLTLDEILNKDEFHVVNHGGKGYKDENGEYTNVYQFKRKILFNDTSKFYTLLSDSNLSNISTYSNSKIFISNRLYKIIMKQINSMKKVVTVAKKDEEKKEVEKKQTQTKTQPFNLSKSVAVLNRLYHEQKIESYHYEPIIELLASKAKIDKKTLLEIKDDVTFNPTIENIRLFFSAFKTLHMSEAYRDLIDKLSSF